MKNQFTTVSHNAMICSLVAYENEAISAAQKRQTSGYGLFEARKVQRIALWSRDVVWVFDAAVQQHFA